MPTTEEDQQSYEGYRAFYVHPSGGIDKWLPPSRPKLIVGTTAAQLVSGARALLTGILIVQGLLQATVTLYDCANVAQIDNSNRVMVLGTPNNPGQMTGANYSSPIVFEDGMIVVVSQVDTYVTITYF